MVHGKRVTEVLGVSQLFSAISYVGGPAIVGYLFDIQGNYRQERRPLTFVHLKERTNVLCILFYKKSLEP